MYHLLDSLRLIANTPLQLGIRNLECGHFNTTMVLKINDITSPDTSEHTFHNRQAEYIYLLRDFVVLRLRNLFQ